MLNGLFTHIEKLNGKGKVPVGQFYGGNDINNPFSELEIRDAFVVLGNDDWAQIELAAEVLQKRLNNRKGDVSLD